MRVDHRSGVAVANERAERRTRKGRSRTLRSDGRGGTSFITTCRRQVQTADLGRSAGKELGAEVWVALDAGRGRLPGGWLDVQDHAPIGREPRRAVVLHGEHDVRDPRDLRHHDGEETSRALDFHPRRSLARPSSRSRGDAAGSRRGRRGRTRPGREHRLPRDPAAGLGIEEPLEAQPVAVGIARPAGVKRDRLSHLGVDDDRRGARPAVHHDHRVVVGLGVTLHRPVHAGGEVVLVAFRHRQIVAWSEEYGLPSAPTTASCELSRGKASPPCVQIGRVSPYGCGRCSVRPSRPSRVWRC